MAEAGGQAADDARRRVRCVEVTGDPIAAPVLADMVRTPSSGAVATFEGTVRDHHRGKEVSRLEYEAYAPMAVREMRAVAEEACRRWPVDGVAVRHRTGALEIGDVAVAIAVSAAHRGPAFDALRYVIDTLKERAPIWKRETGPDGTFWIEGPDHVQAAD